jgi:toxin ParE1/3/4
MARYVLSPRARQDIDDIWDYTAKHWGSDQAERYLRQLQAAIELVAANPFLGRSCEHIRPGYRKFPAGAHVLFYRAEGSRTDVVRILHARMDIDRHFEF